MADYFTWIWEGCGSVLAGPLVVVESEVLRADLLHFGQAKASGEDDTEAARSFCLPRLFFVAFCLSSSNSRLAFLTDERQRPRFESSRCHGRLLIPYLCKLSL